MNRAVSLLPILLLVAVAASSAAGATVTGTVIDAAMPTGQPMAFINVDIRMDSDNSIITTVATDGAGVYTATVPDSTDVHAIAHWEFLLRPEAFYQNKVIRVLDVINGTTTNETFTEKSTQSSTMPTNSGTGTLVLDITMDQVQPVGIQSLFIQIQIAMEFVRLHKGSVAWQPNRDIPVHIRADDVAQFDPNDQTLHIQSISFDGTGNAADRVTIYHETNHLIHYYLNGMTFPPTDAGCACHGLRTEEDPSCAYLEAWASYVAQLTAEDQPVVSGFYAQYRDPARRHWRGGSWIPGCDSGPSDNTFLPTGYDGCPSSCGFESGEVVEGAVGGALFGWDDRSGFGFEDALRVVAVDRPTDIRGFAEAMAIRSGGDGSAGAADVFSILADHGIVYSRALFGSTPFEPIVIDEPPDNAAPDDGNVKEIDGALFVRGKATARFEAASSTLLGVSQRIEFTEVALTFQQATDDLDGSPGFANTLPFVSTSSGMLEFDTGGAGWQDGDCDLLLVAKSVHGYVDSFNPMWGPDSGGLNADGNILVGTDEKYLKRIGGWYDKDRDSGTPAMDPAKEGKVIVDNTPPKVSGFSIVPGLP